MNPLKAIVIGASAGGLQALKYMVEQIPLPMKVPVLVVQHISPDSDDSWISRIGQRGIRVKEAEDKEPILEAHVYIAPPDYHMLVEQDMTIALSKDEKVNFSRPSIDVLFESAADVFGKHLAGIVLTGSNSDGSKGLKKIKEKGGIAIVQHPEEAEYKEMPLAAVKISKVDHILTLQEISNFLGEYHLLKS